MADILLDVPTSLIDASAATSVFSPGAATSFAPAPRAPKAQLFGFEVTNGIRAEVAQEIVVKARLGHRARISFLNAHCVNTAAKDPAYRRALRSSDTILPDGSGMRIAARWADQPMLDNLNGTDLFPEICARAADMGVAIYLLGAAPGRAAATAARMIELYPSLRIAGARDGYFTDGDEAPLIEAINRSGAGILLVGMGVPRQELWLERIAPHLHVPVVLGVGGLFDYYSGEIPRAPVILRAVGCEWVWRLAQEPRRLARRYLVGNGEFLTRAAVQAVARSEALDAVSQRVKRTGDLLAAAVLLLVALPIFLAAAIMIRMEDGGPVFFRQTRIGRDGRPFEMLKFRSMRTNAERERASLLHETDRDDMCFKMRVDPRVTRVGRALRRSSLDELPQIINVLKGDMSLVGPRPALPCEVVRYDEQTRARLRGLPGITGTWQIAGRAEIPFGQQVEMDKKYLAGRSFFGDLSIIARTIPAVVSGRGAY